MAQKFYESLQIGATGNGTYWTSDVATGLLGTVGGITFVKCDVSGNYITGVNAVTFFMPYAGMDVKFNAEGTLTLRSRNITIELNEGNFYGHGGAGTVAAFYNTLVGFAY
jgi:hypothetical protein